MAPLRSRDLHARDLDLGNPGGDELIRFCIAFTTTAGVFVAFRVGIRAKRKLLGWDDFWIGVAFVSICESLHHACSTASFTTMSESRRCNYTVRMTDLNNFD